MIQYRNIHTTALDWYQSNGGLGFVLAVSVALKVILMIFCHDKVITVDGVRYISAAQEFAEGNFSAGLALYPMPVYPLVIAMFYKIVPNWIVAARLVSFLSLSIAVVPIYLISKRLFDHRAAFWAALTYSLAPMNHQMTLNVYREPIFACMFIWAVYIFFTAITTKQLKWFAAAAVCTLLPSLFRVEGTILLVVFPLMLIGLVIINKEDRKDYLKGLMLWSLILFLLLCTTFLFTRSTHLIFMRFDEILSQFHNVLTFNFLDNYHQIEQHLRAMEVHASAPAYGRNFAKIARQYMWLIYFFRLLHSIVNMLSPVFLVLLLFGVRQIFRKDTIYLALIFVAYLLLVYVYYIQRDFLMDRFLFTPTLLLYPFVGVGMLNLLSKLNAYAHFKYLKAVTVSLLLAFILVGYGQLFEKKEYIIHLTANWLREQNLHHARIIDTDIRIPYTAGRHVYRDLDKSYIYHQPLDRDYSDIEDYAIKYDMDLIIVKVSRRRADLLPPIDIYQKIKQINWRHRIVMVYASPAFMKKRTDLSRQL